MSYWRKAVEPAQAVKRAVDAIVFALVGHDDPAEKDARDPRRELPGGVWAPRGEIHHFDDLEDWLRR